MSILSLGNIAKVKAYGESAFYSILTVLVYIDKSANLVLDSASNPILLTVRAIIAFRISVSIVGYFAMIKK
jgi:hypothetical protein